MSLATVNLVFCADKNYVKHLGALLCSIFENKKGQYNVNVFFVSDGLIKGDIEKFSYLSEKYGFTFKNITISSNDFQNFPVRGNITNAAYFRLLIPEILPKEITKAIYLDIDIIVNCDICNLFEKQLLDYVLAAVPALIDYKKKIGFPVESLYFNSGVMLLNLEKMRQEKLTYRAMEFIKNNPHRIILFDQDALNILLENRWLALENKFNIEVGDYTLVDLNDSIIHYCGSTKPWHYNYIGNHKKYYLKYSKMSPWGLDINFSFSALLKKILKLILPPKIVLLLCDVKRFFINNFSYSYAKKFFKIIAGIIDAIGNIIFYFFYEKEIEVKKINKCLIVKLDNIGDCFLMAPIFKKLKSKNNNLKIDVVCLEASKDIFVNVEGVDNVIAIKNRSLKELLSILPAIKKEEYDLFIDARGYAKVALFSFLSGIKRRVGFLEEVFGFLYTKKIKPPIGYHESVRYYFLLRELGIAVEDWKPALLPNISMNFLNLGEKVCAIHPGASLPYKRWPLENWIDLIKKILLQNEEIKIAILGSKDEVGLADEIIKKVGSDRVYGLVGKMSLLENYHFLSKCKMFIGSDSALGHLAGPQEIATIILMNRALDKDRWKPLGSKVEVITANSNEHVCKFDKCEYPCPNMVSVSVEQVLKLIRILCSLS